MQFNFTSQRGLPGEWYIAVPACRWIETERNFCISERASAIISTLSSSSLKLRDSSYARSIFKKKKITEIKKFWG